MTVWWLLLGAILIFGAGVLIGAVVVACCSLAGRSDCRLAAVKVGTYACQVLTDGLVLDDLWCAGADGKGPGEWCGSCRLLRKEEKG